MESCKHINILNLPYSGKLCNECKSIFIDNEFDKNLTKERFDDIMKVLAENYNGNIKENPKWVYTYNFVKPKETEKVCYHLKKDELNGAIFCIECGEEFEYMDRKAECEEVKAFKKVIHEFQGGYDETVEKIPQELFEFLQKMFPGKKSEVTKPQLRNALKSQKGYQRFVKVVHWIHHAFTGVEKNYINGCMKELVEDYEYLCEMFRDLKKIPFDPQLILCVLLDNHDCDHDRSEFNFKNYSESKEEKLIEAVTN